jgi:hypothetical protein
MSTIPDPYNILATLREEIQTWLQTANRGRNALIGERYIIVDHLDRAMAIGPGGTYSLEQARPDLFGASYLTHEAALKVAAALPALQLTAVDGCEYAKQRAMKAQLLLNGLSEKMASRARDASTLAAVDGNVARAERARSAQEDALLRERVLAAVVRELGVAAPAVGSKAREELADRLFHAVAAHSLARVALLSKDLRASLEEAYFQSENDAGAYGRDWRRETVINGKRGLADESDEALLERVILSVGHDYLVGPEGAWFGPNEREFLALMAQEGQVEVVRAAVLDEPQGRTLETAEALAHRYLELGMDNPFEAVLLEHELRISAAAPVA